MEDYIFLIIAVILSIVGAINKKKKADNNPFAEKPERPKNFFMDQLLGEDFLAGAEEIKPAPKPKVVKKPVVIPPPARTPQQYRPSFVSNLPDRAKRTMKPTVAYSVAEESGPEPETDDQPGYVEDFSLRKAFVYSEILQRKYE